MFIAPASFTRHLLRSKIFRCKILVPAKMRKFSTSQSFKYYMQSITFGHDILLLTGSRNKLQYYQQLQTNWRSSSSINFILLWKR